MNYFKKYFGKKKKEELIPEQDFSQEQYGENYEAKKKGLESILGKMHHVVGHATVPFAFGGTVDMYYFPNHIPGTGIATMELLDPDGNGPKPNELGTYELVAFTKLHYDGSNGTEGEFDLIDRRICEMLTSIGNFSFQAVLNPKETYEKPWYDGEHRYFIFDNYAPDRNEFLIGNRKHHLLLCLEIFKNELEFAMENGSDVLLDKLKEAGHYPYSDLSRNSVV